MAASIRKVMKCVADVSLIKALRLRTCLTTQRYIHSTSSTYCIKEPDDEVHQSLDEDFDNEFDVEDEMIEQKSFATLFRSSQFVQLGDLRNKYVTGKIHQVVNNDLYIDFGGKFLCCCPKPHFSSESFFKGQYVKLYLHQFEMVSTFMGSETAVTLLEADCTLIKGAPKKTDNVKDNSPK